MAWNRKDTILVQASCQEWQELQRLTYPVHADYCRRWRMDFMPIHGNLMPEYCHKSPQWLPSYAIRLAYQAGYERVIWLDVDCLIVRPEVDLREACPKEGGIGAVWHEFSPEDAPPPFYSHYNVGALYLQRSQPTSLFLSAWWQTDDENHPWGNQHAFNLNVGMVKQHYCVKEIGREWNSTHAFPSWNVPSVVMHWAGTGGSMEDRYAGMQQGIERRGLR